MKAPVGEYRRFRFPGEEITWAGENPWSKGFCFGTESGKILFLAEVGQSESEYEVIESEVCDEPVNDVAFWKDVVGVTTRSEVRIYRRAPSMGKLDIMSGLSSGAHGITATPRGLFLAPMGTGGLYCFDSKQGSQGTGWVEECPQVVRNYYKIVYLGESAGTEVFSCATRADGLARIQLDSTNTRRVSSLTAPSLDLIDVATPQAAKRPFAVVGLSVDRSLIFVRNILEFDQQNPERLKLEELLGTPYSLMCARGHVFVLTSEEIVMLPHLGARFLDGQPLDAPLRAFHSPVQAVDAYVVGEKYLMIVMDEGVRVSEILPTNTAGNARVASGEFLDAQPWSDSQTTPRLVNTQWIPAA
jgi:hypothetical protein